MNLLRHDLPEMPQLLELLWHNLAEQLNLLSSVLLEVLQLLDLLGDRLQQLQPVGCTCAGCAPNEKGTLPAVNGLCHGDP